MSLKKILKNQPGNIEEFAEYAKENGNSARVLFYSTWIADQTGYQIINGKTIYSSGSIEETLAHTDKRMVKKLRPEYRLKTDAMDEKTLTKLCNELIPTLKKQAQSNLDYLDSQNIKYELFEMIES